MKRMRMVRNEFGIAVKMACMSCAHKVGTRLRATRYCNVRQKAVEPTDVCRQWQMSDQLKAAGSGQGAVRDMRTKEVVIG